ncbi:hypothetical protein [Nannocystis pusilla]|uniref:Lipoprotein n=1 Tax=Nannocystis pusilla TaxID=889268 RepID=A0ABS7TL69_9BACT|nr:hypothetical protein [Nannocystis pusilla]MBZ5708841.1 hypothetical protein [Nannocystis pusilla]
MRLLPAALLAAALGCGDQHLDVSTDTAGHTAGDTADVPAGSTVVVAVVNPVVNSPHNTGVPGELGDVRDGVDVDPEPGGAAVTVDGLAVADVPVASIDLHVGPATLGLDVDAAGDVYDAPIAFDGGATAYFANTPIRYAVGEGGGAIFFDPVTGLSEIATTLEEDNVVVVLGPGVYVGDLVIKGTDVVVFGEGWGDYEVVIDGSVSAEGNGVRMRGVTITGDLAAKGNNFGISFSRVFGATSITGQAGAYLRNIFCGPTTVPSSNATLLDNYGVPPIEAPPPGQCEL